MPFGSRGSHTPCGMGRKTTQNHIAQGMGSGKKNHRQKETKLRERVSRSSGQDQILLRSNREKNLPLMKKGRRRLQEELRIQAKDGLIIKNMQVRMTANQIIKLFQTPGSGDSHQNKHTKARNLRDTDSRVLHRGDGHKKHKVKLPRGKDT
ncbi:hypothetical protein NDU88_001933 [Pleurodeles waltl]|uniref:Uncharacterized protein n=1 Tax=Pleurodeles waltl TaxID=8319 RepID=A0AAV7LCG5_PLEWA|nr:hypothetical protein NDU88_001933 [Pleurodeles waltl]